MWRTVQRLRAARVQGDRGRRAAAEIAALAQQAEDLGRTHKGFLKETAVRAKAELANRVDEICRRRRGRARASHPVAKFYLKTRHWSWAQAANFWAAHSRNGRLPILGSKADHEACGIPWSGTGRGASAGGGSQKRQGEGPLLLFFERKRPREGGGGGGKGSGMAAHDTTDEQDLALSSDADGDIQQKRRRLDEEDGGKKRRRDEGGGGGGGHHGEDEKHAHKRVKRDTGAVGSRHTSSSSRQQTINDMWGSGGGGREKTGIG